jgi:hypothetical protein
LNRAESEVSKRETRNRLLGAVVVTNQTTPLNTDVFSRQLFRRNHREKEAPSDSLLIKPLLASGQIQVLRPKKPKRSKKIHESQSLNPKDDMT